MISSSENDSGGNSWTPEIPFESLTEVHRPPRSLIGWWAMMTIWLNIVYWIVFDQGGMVIPEWDKLWQISVLFLLALSWNTNQNK